jgi:hypothetical protein
MAFGITMSSDSKDSESIVLVSIPFLSVVFLELKQGTYPF